MAARRKTCWTQILASRNGSSSNLPFVTITFMSQKKISFWCRRGPHAVEDQMKQEPIILRRFELFESLTLEQQNSVSTNPGGVLGRVTNGNPTLTTNGTCSLNCPSSGPFTIHTVQSCWSRFVNLASNPVWVVRSPDVKVKRAGSTNSTSNLRKNSGRIFVSSSIAMFLPMQTREPLPNARLVASISATTSGDDSSQRSV